MWISSCCDGTASLIAPMVYSLIQPLDSSLINAITGKEVRRAGKGQECGLLQLLAAPSVLKVMFGWGYNKMDHMDKNF